MTNEEPIPSDQLNSEQHYEDNDTFLVTVQATFPVQAPTAAIANEAILRTIREDATSFETLEVTKQ